MSNSVRSGIFKLSKSCILGKFLYGDIFENPLNPILYLFTYFSKKTNVLRLFLIFVPIKVSSNLKLQKMPKITQQRDMIGQQILNYQIINKIGEGGMGSVYLAKHTQLDRKAAIKALHPNLVNNPHIRERFKNEASTMAHLKHPNIVSLYDYMESPQGLFLIIEFVEGYPLDEFIQKVSGPISEDKVAFLFGKILDGFAYAHSQGVIHRDIKPSNIMISPDGQDVKILDFGIAKLLGNNSKSLTKTGSRMGTVLYMSPEQVKGQELDQRSDIYSLGVTLFQMLTGKCPYNEANMTEYEVYEQIVNYTLPRVKTFYPSVSGRMQAIIDKATAKDPAERFSSCLEFKRALEGMIANGGTTQNPANFAQPTYNSPSSLQDTNPLQTGARYKRRKRRWVYPVIIVFLLMAIGAVTVFLNPLDIPQFRSWSIANQLKSDASFKIEIKEKVQDFYKAVESRNFSNIAPFYSDSLDNYFENLNRSLDPDIKASYRIYWDAYVGEKHEIDWDSYEYTHDEEGNHIAKIKMRYYFKMKGEDWKNLMTNAEIRFDSNFLIYYINKFKEPEATND